MITINLLASQQKQDLTTSKTNISIIGSFVILFSVVIILSIALYFMNDLQKQNLDSLNQETLNIEKFLNQENNQNLEKKIKDINYYLSTIKKIENERTNFANVLAEIANLTPDNIRLIEINLNKPLKNFEIKGIAKTRDSLIKFDENLQQANDFKDIQSPLSNITTSNDIEFTLSGNLTDQALK